MAKLEKRQLSWSEDPASGVRRSSPPEQPGLSDLAVRLTAARNDNRSATRPQPRAALAAVAALLLVSAWLWSRPGEQSAQIVVKPLPLTASIHSEPAPPPPAATPAPPTFELELSASPAEAQLMLDGVVLPQNPYRGRVPADDGLHVLRAVAPGLQSQERVITFDRDRSLSLTLSRVQVLHPLGRSQRAPAAAAPSTTPARARAAEAEYGEPLAPRQRTREIYEEDPYR